MPQEAFDKLIQVISSLGGLVLAAFALFGVRPQVSPVQ